MTVNNASLRARMMGGEDIFFAALSLSELPMLLVDPAFPDAPIVYCNSAFCKLTGYDRDEIIGVNCRFLQGVNTDKTEAKRLRLSAEAGASVTVTLLNYKRDGSEFYNQVSVSPVRDEFEETVYYFGTSVDIADQMQIAALQEQRDDALRGIEACIATRLRLTRLISTTHDLLQQVADQPNRSLELCAAAQSVLQEALVGVAPIDG